ncbi:MAG TPA: methylenetetrahydrofolate--tRNA-(uracil(54)-C(5))-methyltransferase (FADH(2)-oxidizing) TrmFO [candidate division Zixibacteria bacterium]|nr:methylenetetrahydrofolate--tRNA-(uracil(54)-C(5))-methyltransferase (FADH(2)-oxidizing) TrmFO [candidate division Zixibacteria bacterium]
MEPVRVIGAGLAGAEAAWQLGRRGVRVELFEMRPRRMTEAHSTADIGELVCSNSLRSNALHTPAGLLKEEMRRLGSVVVRAAEAARVPAGSALAVDRALFSAALGEALAALPTVRVVREEVVEVPDGLTIIATGPLTSAALGEALAAMLGSEHLYFYDAISPIVTAESIDMKVAFRASRHGFEEGDYLNLPLTREEYERFVDALRTAERVPTRSFERFVPFEGCMPIEEMADRGRETLAFGPMRAVGLVDPRTGRRPYAVVQLRQENREATLYNLVGFQTKMTYPEQRRVFSMLPGLAQAEFVRLGSLHRNTFIDAPAHLQPTLQWRRRESLLFAGQITGVEGYVESAASGLLAGLNAVLLVAGKPPVVPPPTTALGSLVRYISDPHRRHFQPMNVNFGLLPPVAGAASKRQKREILAQRALRDLETWRRLVEIELRGASAAGTASVP